MVLMPVTSASQGSTENLQSKVNAIQGQMDGLVKMGAKYAYAQLANKNRLSPFAVAAEKNGNTLMLEIPKKEVNATVAQKVIKLREMLKLAADNDRIYAGAVFVQAQVPHNGEQVDGIAMELEHESGLSAMRFSPYEIDRENKKINFKKPVNQIKPVVFFKDVLAKAKAKE